MQDDHIHRGLMTPTVAQASSSHSIWFPADTQASWRPTSSSVAHLLGRSTTQPVSEASRLRPLSAAAAAAAPRRFTKQPCPSPAWGSVSAGLSGAGNAERSDWLQDGQHSLIQGEPVSCDTEQIQGIRELPHLGSSPYQRAEAGDSGSLPAQEAKLGSSPLAQHSWSEVEKSMHSPANRPSSLHFGDASWGKSSSQQRSALSEETDCSLSRLRTTASFTSGMRPASAGLQAYWMGASDSHPNALSDKSFDKSCGRASDPGPAPHLHTVKRPSLISTRFSHQSSPLAEESQPSTGLHSAQRRSSLTFHAEQQQVSVLGQRNSRLYSAESLQPRRLRPSMLADAVLSLTQHDAGDAQEHLQPEAFSAALTDNWSQLQSQSRQSPVAAALSDDSPWDSQPGSLHLRHQKTWHLPSASQTYAQQQQHQPPQPQQQQQQQPFRQRHSMLQSLEDAQAVPRQSWMQSEAEAHAAAARRSSLAGSDSQAAAKQLSLLDDEGPSKGRSHKRPEVDALLEVLVSHCRLAKFLPDLNSHCQSARRAHL